MTLQYFLSAYTKADHMVAYHKRQLKKLTIRTHLSLGVAVGISMGILFLWGNHIPVPLPFALFAGWALIYSSIMMVLAYRFNKNVIRPAQEEVFDRWVALTEVEFIPVSNKE